MALITLPADGTPWTTQGSAIVSQCNAVAASFIDVNMDAGGTSTAQAIGTGGAGPPWTAGKLQLGVEASDVNNLWNTSTYVYTVPTTGIYVMNALIRPVDGQFAKATWPDGSGLGIGVHTSETDGVWFQWSKVMWMSGVGGNRLTLPYARIGAYTANDQLRLYMFQDSGGTVNINRAALQIYRIG